MATLQDLLGRQIVWRGGAPGAGRVPAVPTEFEMLDRELPGGGWPVGALTEILYASEGTGELQCVMPALAALTRQGRRVAWVAPPHRPYAPGLLESGVRVECLTLVRVKQRQDALWATEQVLRAGACHALLAWLPAANYAELRRLAVAAESSPGFVVLFRSPRVLHESSPSRVRLVLESCEGRLVARILKRRGAPSAAPLGIPVGRPLRALDRISFPVAGARSAAARARLETVA